MTIKETIKKAVNKLPGKKADEEVEEDTKKKEEETSLEEVQEAIQKETDETPTPPTPEEERMNLYDLIDTYKQLVQQRVEMISERDLNTLKANSQIAIQDMVIERNLKTLRKVASTEQIEEHTKDALKEIGENMEL